MRPSRQQFTFGNRNIVNNESIVQADVSDRTAMSLHDTWLPLDRLIQGGFPNGFQASASAPADSTNCADVVLLKMILFRTNRSAA